MRNRKILGRRLKKDRTTLPEKRAFDLAVDVANYNPGPYLYTGEYADFLNNAVRELTKIMTKAKPDDMNVEMFDSYIDARNHAMYASARTQFVGKCNLHSHHERVLSGDASRLQGFLDLIRQDLEVLRGKRDDLYRQVGMEPPARPEATTAEADVPAPAEPEADAEAPEADSNAQPVPSLTVLPQPKDPIPMPIPDPDDVKEEIQNG